MEIIEKIKTYEDALQATGRPDVHDMSAFGNEYAFAGSGSRLKLKSRELADYCGKQFEDIWKDIQLG